MSEAIHRSNRKCKMSKWERHACSLESSSSPGTSDDDSGDDSPKQPSPTLECSPSITSLSSPPPIPTMTSTNTLVWSWSIASVASFASVSAETDESRRAKFDKCYKMATESDADILSAYSLNNLFLFSNYMVESQMEQWSSEVYKHFKMPPFITYKKDVVTYIFTCLM